MTYLLRRIHDGRKLYYALDDPGWVLEQSRATRFDVGLHDLLAPRADTDAVWVRLREHGYFSSREVPATDSPF